MRGPEQKYRIIDKLDSGGMAEIYRAEAELMQGMKKKVAIKRILPHLTKNKKFVAMFLDEARLSLYLDHANIVHVFDIGRSGDTYFIVMEYVDGPNLRTVNETMRRLNEPVSMEKAIFILMEVCKGLGYAHDMLSPDDNSPLQIVHRDVSPPNILLSRNGEIKLVDFGLAKAASQLENTDPGVVKGKFSYLSPEVASGAPVDHRADIFASGIILFELLTGRRLFYGETDYQTVELVRQAKIPSLSTINPAVPAELNQIVQRALARDPDHRFQHAYEMQEALAQFLFARGMKVTSRDIATMVRRCLTERGERKPPNTRVRGRVINQLIHEEVLKFTSLDSSDFDPNAEAKEKDSSEGAGPLNPQDFIDPRIWTSELPAIDGKSEESQPDADFQVQDFQQDLLPEVTPLEGVLEGGQTNEGFRLPEEPKSKPPKRWKGAVTAVTLFILLGAATIFVLHSMGMLGSEPEEKNHDIIYPK
ncbi:MAG: serine/threonine protein kinase [Deltaproteobacteria bacterium]|nr:serine/threonine protein kinase [Deltaproteobacteria bacterium]